MKNIVSELIEKNYKDMYSSVNRLEYEVRNVAMKSDIAEIYLQLQEIKKVLEENNMQIVKQDPEEREELIKQIIELDRQEAVQDISESILEARQIKRLQRKGPLASIKNWVEDKYFQHSNISSAIKNNLYDISTVDDEEIQTIINNL